MSDDPTGPDGSAAFHHSNAENTQESETTAIRSGGTAAIRSSETVTATFPSGHTPAATIHSDETARATIQSGETVTVQTGETVTIQPGETAIIQSGETAIIQSGETAIIHPSETATAQPGETAIIQPSETAVIQPGERETIQSTKIATIPSSEREITQAGETATIQYDEKETIPTGETAAISSDETATFPSGVTTTIQSRETDTIQSGETAATQPENAALGNFHNEITLSDLPDIVLSTVFRYLYWKEKIHVVQAFPECGRILETCLGWERFENDRTYAHSHQALASSHYLFEELTCIAQYGCYFTHVVLWIQNFLSLPPSPHANDAEDAVIGMGTDFSLLHAVETHCARLKSLTVYHPHNLSSAAILLSYSVYIHPLQNIVRYRSNFRLSLCRLLYSSVESHTGAADLLYFYRVHNLLQMLTMLDYSHGLILASNATPQYILAECRSLVVLKCPIQNLNTLLVQQLLSFSLQELYLVNDEHTLNLHFVEKDNISWLMLRPRPGRSFEVHYIYKNRSLCPGHLCLNPYARSLVLESLCSSVSRALLRCVADLYGDSLQCLALILSVWEPLMPFSDPQDLASNFQYMATRLKKLHTAVLNVIIPSDAALALAKYAPSLTNLLLYEHKIFFGEKAVVTQDEVSTLKDMISEALGRPWRPIRLDENLYQLSDCRLYLLFEEIVSQWDRFF